MHYFARKRAGSRGTLRGFEYSIRIISLITFVIINSLIGSNYFDRLHGKNKIISGDVRGKNHCCDRSISARIAILKYIFSSLIESILLSLLTFV